MPSATIRPLLIGLLLTLLCAAVFGEVCRQDFVLWDDPIHVYDNPYLRPVTWPHVWHFWRHPYENLYIPVSYSVFAALAFLARLPAPKMMSDGMMVSLDPHVFHMASLLLHLCNVLLVFGLLRRLVKNDWAAGAGALLFGLHPVQVESVAWVSELRGLLAGLFSLLALRGYVEYALARRDGVGNARVRYVAGALCFALALLCKPSAVTVPIMAWILDCFIIRHPFRNVAISLGLWGILSGLCLLLTYLAQPVQAGITAPLWTRPFIAGDALAFYLGKLLWPEGLGIDYGRTPTFVLAHWWGYATWLLPMLLSILLWRVRRRFPWLWVSGAVFTAGLLPVLGLTPFAFQGYSTVADRYLYLALLGPALALAWSLSRLTQRSALLAGSVCAGIFALLGFGSSLQAMTWGSSFALFQDALAVNPRSGMAHYNLALLLAAQGKQAEADAHFREASRLKLASANVTAEYR